MLQVYSQILWPFPEAQGRERGVRLASQWPAEQPQSPHRGTGVMLRPGAKRLDPWPEEPPHPLPAGLVLSRPLGPLHTGAAGPWEGRKGWGGASLARGSGSTGLGGRWQQIEAFLRVC